VAHDGTVCDVTAQNVMSALPPKADISSAATIVR